MKIAVIGATGLVGNKMIQILEERNFPITEFYLVASDEEVGKKIMFRNGSYKVISMQEAITKHIDIALFSAGETVSIEWAPKFAAAGTTVIDNSSAWRMEKNTKLIVPEINADELTKDDKIIANPNCSTIQMVMALNPLHKRYKVKRVIVSTYQSVTGAGKVAMYQLMNERNGIKGEMAYTYPLDMNVIPQIDTFLDNGYTKEEMKLVNETKKIMQDETIKITATAVRIPVIGGHCEAVNVEFENEFEIDEIMGILLTTPGITLIDDIDNLQYPTLKDAHNRDEVFVGRIRRDETQPKTLNMWIVADNLRKGAATNAIQIAEYLLGKNWFVQSIDSIYEKELEK